MSSSPDFTNHLANEKSPYLLAHAHNPVDWYPWGPVAFEKARQLDKPILLSIGYATCHWCHVMMHESFDNEAIARQVNHDFIAIKVDREERPDIDHIYMRLTTAISGQGGWPLTVFLTPDAKAFYGGTYFPPEPKWGSPGFSQVLSSISAAWGNNRTDILNSGQEFCDMFRRQNAVVPSDTMPTQASLIKAFDDLKASFDSAHGGFGHAPKFPMGHQISFLLRYFKRSGNEQAWRMAEATLTAMARGGLCDQVGGGFHRYSTDERWHVPHFEKMLYDQALLARAYLEMHQVTGEVHHAQIANSILTFVLSELRHPLGGFYCALDADSVVPGTTHSQEGAFYVYTQEEIANTLGPRDSVIFNVAYGVRESGNAVSDPHGEFMGKNILYRALPLEELAKQFHQNPGEIELILKSSLAKLKALRDGRPRPQCDDKILTDWNGLMISTLAYASRVLNDESYANAAAQSADFILTHMFSQGRLKHFWRQGVSDAPATLDDYAFFIHGLLDLNDATVNTKYVTAARQLGDMMIELFADPAGGFYLTAHDSEALVLRPKDGYDGAMPSGNALAAVCLLRLHAMTQTQVYLDHAEGVLKWFAVQLEHAPSAHLVLLAALDLHLSGPLTITFQGDPQDVGIAKMLKVVYKHFVPQKVLVRQPQAGPLKVQLCYQGRCLMPVMTVDELEKCLVDLLQPYVKE